MFYFQETSVLLGALVEDVPFCLELAFAKGDVIYVSGNRGFYGPSVELKYPPTFNAKNGVIDKALWAELPTGLETNAMSHKQRHEM